MTNTRHPAGGGPMQRAAEAISGFAAAVFDDAKPPPAWARAVSISLARVVETCLGLNWPQVERNEPELQELFPVEPGRIDRLRQIATKKLGRNSLYWMIDGATEHTTEAPEPVRGDLVDDLEELYCDLSPGLTAWSTDPKLYERSILWDWQPHSKDIPSRMECVPCELSCSFFVIVRSEPLGVSGTSRARARLRGRRGPLLNGERRAHKAKFGQLSLPKGEVHRERTIQKMR
jgi:hypothetical protein